MTDASKLPADRAEPPASDELFQPYRSPGFLLELAGESPDGSLPTTLGLCAALALLGGSFTLAHAGPPALGIGCLTAAALLTSAARRAF